MNDRIIKLIGNDSYNKIKSTSVCVVGLGGVGGYVVEGLVRSGIGNIIIVDYDTIDISNLNRQLISNNSNLSLFKVDEFEKRIKLINPNCKVIKVNIKLDASNIDSLFCYKFDYLVDACDTIIVKELLIKNCLEKGIGIISSMGTGNKLKASLLEITDLRKTSYDPIAKKLRKYVVDNKIKGKIPVVYSKEQGNRFSGSIPSMVFVPAVAGMLCANYVVNDIINV